MDNLTVAGIVASLIGVAVGPGGVFYFLVKRGLNGSVQAVERMDRTLGRISAIQSMDHDSLTKAVTALEQIKQENRHYHKMTDQHARDIVAIQSRCDLLHRGLKGEPE